LVAHIRVPSKPKGFNQYPLMQSSRKSGVHFTAWRFAPKRAN
jgi:hypothetical protein